jgi:serine/threonine protein kinase
MLSKETVDEMDQEEFLSEARTMSELAQHPNVIKMMGFCRGEKLCIISGKPMLRYELMRCNQTLMRWFFFSPSELITGGSLKTHVYNTQHSLSFDVQFNFLKDISNGMAYLHRNDIVHRLVMLEI